MATANNSSAGDGLALRTLMIVLFTGALAALVALCFAHTSGAPAAVGIGTLIFIASFAMGCFFGFLFGVPRVLSKEPATQVVANAGAASPPAAATPEQPDKTSARSSARLLQSNTNLERISDWLTTLLVGAGLVELHNVNDGLIMFRQYLEQTAKVFPAAAPGLGASAGAIPAVGPLLLVFGVAAGFLYMYLNTRLVLIRLFQSIEELLSGGEVLPPSEQRAVKAFAEDTDRQPSFVGRQFAAKKNVTVEDALNLMFDLLYKSDPQKVIDLGAQLTGTDATRRADYWFYLAAAFGQLLHHLPRDTAEWASARDNALDCARRAVSIDDSYRNRLWNISDPASSDNDLAPLREDPEFRRLVGRS